MLFAEQFAAAYGIGLALTFLRFPSRKLPSLDAWFAALSLLAYGYVTARFPQLTALASIVSLETLTLSLILTALTVEAVRRTIGWSLVAILLVIAGYVLIGHLVPGRLTTSRVGWAELLVYLNLDNNGLLGIILQITVIITEHLATINGPRRHSPPSRLRGVGRLY